jgi:8-oxo-dGTP pyrophosphatase MutT (NUDIX family)
MEPQDEAGERAQAGPSGKVDEAEQPGTPARTTRRRRGRTTRRRAEPKPHVATKTEVSAGGVVYRKHAGQIEVILASRRTRRGEVAWGLAKGGIEAGESIEDAAVREVREETGLEATIERSLGETRYFYVWEAVRIRKTVHFFLMKATGRGDVNDRDDEMEDVRWFPLDHALKRAAYRGEREVLGRAASILRTDRRGARKRRRRPRHRATTTDGDST